MAFPCVLWHFTVYNGLKRSNILVLILSHAHRDQTCLVIIRKFYGQFNNILLVLGKYSHELATLHLVKSYCLPTLLYGCETWSFIKRSCTKPVSLGTTVFVECFPVAGEKALSHYSITVNHCLYLILSTNVGFYFGIKC